MPQMGEPIKPGEEMLPMTFLPTYLDGTIRNLPVYWDKASGILFAYDKFEEDRYAVKDESQLIRPPQES
jgi:hypothetical protein